MKEIKCPKCNTTIQVNESDFNSIVKQVRDQEFLKELKNREEIFNKDKESALKLNEAALEKKYSDKINELNLEIQKLTSELEQNKENQKNSLRIETDNIKSSYQKELEDYKIKIVKLTEEINSKELENKVALKNAIFEKDKDILELQKELENSKTEYLLKEKSLHENYTEKLKTKDEQIEYYRDFKAKQSTKMIGESLEQHCNTEFNRLRPMFGPNTYFEKDNDAKTGSKGDFIFRDYDEEGTEIISIMFEMKNEADETATKHKNEDFLKELDKDRKEKNCEYAILVSLLEINNDLYNDGIVDMSYKYPKMYVIRPQFFIPIITLLRNASLNSLKYKKQIVALENQNIDISHFEDNINLFKESFSRNYRIASEKFKKAIEEIDKTIDHLQKTKDALISSENQLRLANNKADELTIKKLTYNSKTMADMFNEINKES